MPVDSSHACAQFCDVHMRVYKSVHSCCTASMSVSIYDHSDYLSVGTAAAHHDQVCLTGHQSLHAAGHKVVLPMHTAATWLLSQSTNVIVLCCRCRQYCCCIVWSMCMDKPGEWYITCSNVIRQDLPDLLRFSTCHDVQSVFFIAADAALYFKVWMSYWQTDCSISDLSAE